MKFFSQLPLAWATFSGATSTAPQNNVAPAVWDGACFYPKADPHFKLDTYPGRWYQVAGTLAPFTAGCKCISANYELNVCVTNFSTYKYKVTTLISPQE